MVVGSGIADNRYLDVSLGAKLCIFNMAAYTLPEGFTDFDMFTFGTALLVGGKWAGINICAKIKVTGHPRGSCIRSETHKR